MRVVSLNVGQPRKVIWQGEPVLTAIFKDPVDRHIRLHRLSFEGDAQADLNVHGGPDKAVYAYPFEHYADWQSQLGRDLTPGAFGENLTTEGLLEDQVHIGDEFRIGTARLAVSQPRMPCYKLGLRFGDPLMVKKFHKAGWPGIYFNVVEEGTVGPNDPIELLHTDDRRITVVAMLKLMLERAPDPAAVRRLLEIPTLAADWRTEFESRI